MVGIDIRMQWPQHGWAAQGDFARDSSSPIRLDLERGPTLIVPKRAAWTGCASAQTSPFASEDLMPTADQRGADRQHKPKQDHDRRRAVIGPTLRLTSRQINLSLEFLIAGIILTGLALWSVGDRSSGWLTFAHGALGITIALLIPAKLAGPIRSGFQRGRATRWVSSFFGLLVLAAPPPVE